MPSWHNTYIACQIEGHVKWVKPERAMGKDIAETMILEQFLRMMDPDLEVWIRECDPKRAASLAEIFMSARTGTKQSTLSVDNYQPGRYMSNGG